MFMLQGTLNFISYILLGASHYRYNNGCFYLSLNLVVEIYVKYSLQMSSFFVLLCESNSKMSICHVM